MFLKPKSPLSKGGRFAKKAQGQTDQDITPHGNNILDCIPDRSSETLHGVVKSHVAAGAALFTDELHGYWGLDKEYQHQIIDHAVKYVDGRIHTTNGLENFWSSLKRGLHGTYVSVEPFHLFRYLDEQCFRFNKRSFTDADRFLMVCNRVSGKRLDWKTLTGKNGAGRVGGAESAADY